MPIKDLPADQRPRERLLARGAEALTNAELLAIFLRTGIPGKSAIDLAHELLEHFDGLRGLFGADLAGFTEQPGMGPAKYVQLQAVLELAKRYLDEDMRRSTVLDDPEATHAYLRQMLGDKPYELFACLLLDSRLQVIEFVELFRGTLNGAPVYPREVVMRALQGGAAAVIFAHNHPSGVAEPSQADRIMTDRLVAALRLVDIRVVDHVIIGGGEPYSFAEHGLLEGRR